MLRKDAGSCYACNRPIVCELCDSCPDHHHSEHTQVPTPKYTLEAVVKQLQSDYDGLSVKVAELHGKVEALKTALKKLA